MSTRLERLERHKRMRSATMTPLVWSQEPPRFRRADIAGWMMDLHGDVYIGHVYSDMRFEGVSVLDGHHACIAVSDVPDARWAGPIPQPEPTDADDGYGISCIKCDCVVQFNGKVVEPWSMVEGDSMCLKCVEIYYPIPAAPKPTGDA